MGRNIFVGLAMAAAFLAAAPEAQAVDQVVGDYNLYGKTSKGKSYQGRVRIYRVGAQLVLTTTVKGNGWRRPEGRAPYSATGPWTFHFTHQNGSQGSVGALDRIAGETKKPAKPMTLEVKDAHHCLKARLKRGGKVVCTESYLPRPEGTALHVTPPRLNTFMPHRPDGPNTVTIRYALEPMNSAMTVQIRVEDKDGNEVHSEESEARDTGAGLSFTWDGKAERGYVDTRKSPYRVTIVASGEGFREEADPVEVVAVPLVDRCWVVSRVGDSGRFTGANKVVDYDDQVVVLGVVRAITGGVRAAERGRTDRAYFLVNDPLPAARVHLSVREGYVDVEQWNTSTWGALDLKWQTVMPLGLHSPAYRPTQNANRETRDGEFTNVIANGDREGKWAGRDVIEYEHRDAGTGPAPREDTEPGTIRYRFDADYRHRALRLGAAAPGSYGKRDPTPTTATEIHSGLTRADFDRNLSGIKDRVHRIARRGNHDNAMLANIELYRRVPWLYGSLGRQVESYIGYDCADMIFGAARRAGLTRRSRYTNAHNLCERITKAVGTHPVLWFDAEGRTITESGDLHPVGVGGSDPNNAQPGDVVFFDWDEDGKWDHTTVLWSNTSGTLDARTRFVWAHHDSNSTDGFYINDLNRLVLRKEKRAVIRMKIRRFKR